MVKEMAIFFLSQVGLGTYAFSFLADPKLTGAGFFKVLIGVSSMAMAMALILALTLNTLNIPFLSLLFLGLILFALSYQYYQKEQSRGPRSQIFYTLLLGLGVGQGLLFKETIDPSFFLYSLLSFLFIGQVHFLMLMGHWYLVTPKMSTEPLIHSLKLTGLFLMLKLLLSVYSLLSWQERPSFQELRPGDSFEWIGLLTRYGVGLFGLGICAFFAMKLTRMRDTQSATGVFYVMVIFLFLGELFSLRLALSKGVLI